MRGWPSAAQEADRGVDVRACGTHDSYSDLHPGQRIERDLVSECLRTARTPIGHAVFPSDTDALIGHIMTGPITPAFSRDRRGQMPHASGVTRVSGNSQTDAM